MPLQKKAMGNGPSTLDDGTSARTVSPTPGPIGLDARKGGSKQAPANMADQIVAFARQRLGDRYGDGECFTLVNDALKHVGAKSAEDYGTVTPDADYVWGTSVSLSALRTGDVIQFRGYRFDRTVETNNPDGSGSTTTETQQRPHHTAIVERLDGGAVVVLEQNAPDGAPGTRTRLFFTSTTTTSGNRTTTISVQGTFWFYRPEAR
jgi:hypothetical protein